MTLSFEEWSKKKREEAENASSGPSMKEETGKRLSFDEWSKQRTRRENSFESDNFVMKTAMDVAERAAKAEEKRRSSKMRQSFGNMVGNVGKAYLEGQEKAYKASDEYKWEQMYSGRSLDEIKDTLGKIDKNSSIYSWLKQYSLSRMSDDELKAEIEAVKANASKYNELKEAYESARKSQGAFLSSGELEGYYDKALPAYEALKAFEDEHGTNASSVFQKELWELENEQGSRMYGSLKDKSDFAQNSGNGSSEALAIIERYDKLNKDLEAIEGKYDLSWKSSAPDEYYSEIAPLLAEKESMEAEYDISALRKEATGKSASGMDTALGVFGNMNYIHDYVNNVDDVQNQAYLENGARDATKDVPSYIERYRYMSEDEVANFNYLWNTAGAEEAEKYLTHIERDLDEQRMMEIAQNAADLAVENPFFAELTRNASSKMSGIGYIAAAGEKIYDAITGTYDGPVNYNSAFMIPAVVSSTISSTTAEKILDATGSINFDEEEHPWLARMLNGKGLADLYLLGTSIADSWTSIGLGGLTGTSPNIGLMLMGGSAATNTMLDAASSGASDEEALALGLVAGASEMVFEKVSLDTLFNGDTRSVVKKVLQQMAAEGGEEFSTSFVNEVADFIIRAEDSNYAQIVEGYVQAGYSEEEAKKEALKDIAISLGWDAVGGMVSGGISGAGYSTVGNAVNDRLLNEAYKAAYAEQAGGIAEEVLQRDGTIETAQNVKDRLEANKKVSGSDIRETVNTADRQRIYDATLDRLQGLGETENVRAVAVALTKQVMGENLNRSDRKVLRDSENAERVRVELGANYSMKNHEDAEWTKSIGTYNTRREKYNQAEIEDAIKKIIGGTSKPKKYNVSDIEQTVRNDSGEEVNIKEIVSTNDGKTTYRLEDGSIVDSEEIKLGSKDIIYAALDEMGVDAPFANLLVERYQITGGVTPEVYAYGIEEAYVYGKLNYPVSEITNGVFSSELSYEQAEFAYRMGKRIAGQDIAKETAIMRKNKKGTDHQGRVHYMGGQRNRSSFTDVQRSAIDVMEMMSSALGVDFNVFESYTKDGQKGRFYKDERGIERLAPNGKYQNGQIYIDLNAGANGEGIMLYTVGHELTHFVKEWSPRKFKILANTLVKYYSENEMSVDEAVNDQMRKAEANGRNISREDAFEEFVADSMESILTSGRVVEMMADIKKQDQGLWEKIKGWFKNLKEKLQKLVETYANRIPDSAEGQVVAQAEELLKELENIFTEGLVEAGDNYQATVNPGEEGMVYTAKGDPVAFITEEGSVMLSMRTYEESGREEFRKYLEKCVNSKRLTKAEMEEMRDGIEEIYEVCKEFKDKYAPFGTWSEAEVIVDEKGKPVFSVVTPNGEYKMNLDFSLVCKKRRTLDAVFNEMAKRGIIDDFELGQKSVVKINEIIRSHGLETACALCFVDAKRFRQAGMADMFVELYNDLVYSLVPAMDRGKIAYFNFSGNKSRADVPGIHEMKNSELDFTHVNEVMKEYGSGTVEYKAAAYIKRSAEARKLLQRGDFMSSGGFDAVKVKNKTIMSLYNSKKGTGGPKAAFGDAQYLNEVIKKARFWTPEKAYSVGGVRIQSFSDYMPRMVFDYVQMVYDLAATKLPAHAYTKEAMFAKQFGLTGIKINMSLIPAIAEGGIAPGLDANGDYVWAGESFDFEEAKKIQNAEGYTENCGTICVGVSKQHILKLLSDPDIRMVIPYHKSGLNRIVAHMNKIEAFTDYTDLKSNPGGCQNTVNKDGKKVAKDFDFNGALRETGDPKAAIQKYFDWCAKNEYTPRFAEFAWHENYYKLIEDFTLYDMNMKYVPQREVRAVFPTDDSAFGSMKKLIKDALEEDAIVEGDRSLKLGQIVDEIQRSLPRTEAEIEEVEVKQADRDLEAKVKLSDRDSDGNQLTEEQQEFFKDSEVRDAQGNLMVMYHGTANGGEFTVFDGDKLGNESRTTQIGQGFYFTNMKKEAESYTKNVDIFGRASKGSNPHLHQVYLNITNPFNVATDSLDMSRVKSVYMDGTYDYFFSNWIPFYMNNKTVGGRTFTKAEVQDMSKADKVSLYVDYLAQLGTKEILSNMVRAYPYGKQSELLASMRNRLGYDGIVEEFKSGQYQYVAFSSEQVKLTTNQKPTSDPDIRYSDRDSDGKQLSVEQQEYFKDSKVRDSEGNLLVMYHGTSSNVKFTVFERRPMVNGKNYGDGFYFTENKNAAYSWGSSTVYKVYVDIKNPYIASSVDGETPDAIVQIIKEKSGKIYDKLSADPNWWGNTYSREEYIEQDSRSWRNPDIALINMVEDSDIPYETDGQYYGEIARRKTEILESLGYDGVIVPSSRRNQNYQEIVAFNSNQIKKTTNKKPTSNPDIRYSDRSVVDRAEEHFGTTTDFNEAGFVLPNGKMLRFTDDQHRGERAWDHRAIGMVYGVDVDLNVNHGYNQESNKHLDSFVEDGGIRFYPGDMDFNSDAGLQLSGSKPITRQQEQTIRAFIEWKKQREENHKPSEDDFSLYVGPLALDIDFGAGADSSGFANKRASHALRYEGGQINADRIINDIRNYYRTGKISGPSVVAQFHYQDRPTESVSNRSLLANALEGVTQNDIEYTRLQEYKGKIATIEAEEKKLHELRAQIKELSFGKGPKDAKKLRELREEANKSANRINIFDKQLLRLEASAPLQEVLKRERNSAYKRIKKENEAYRERYRERVKESNAKIQARTMLQREVLKTANWIKHPKKGEVKCPDILKAPYAEFLQSIDLSSAKLQRTGEMSNNDMRVASAMDSLATSVEKILRNQNPSVDGGEDLSIGYLDLPENFVQKLREASERIKGGMDANYGPVRDMASEEIKTITDTIRQLNHAIKEMSTLYSNMRFESVEAVGSTTTDFLESLGEIEASKKGADFVQWDNALPFYAFKRFGAGGESIFEELMDAQDNLAFKSQEIFDFQKKTWNDKEANEWSKDEHEVELTGGNKITLTTSQAMSLYCLSKRAHALQHLLVGGAKIAGLQKGSKQKSDTSTLLNQSDLDLIAKSLTDRQRSIAEGIQEFMSTVCAEWGNEISMKRFLTREFNEQFYFPIEVDGETRNVSDPTAQQSDLYRLLNISATKELVPNANSRVVVRNIFEVFAGHSADMARLNSYGMALLDYMKWLNYRETDVNKAGQKTMRGVRDAMRRSYGKAATSYVLNLIKDVNGRPSDGGDPTLLMKWMRNAKTASVGNSLRTATLQITSYPRAAAVLSLKNLALGLTRIPNIKRAQKYCGIALWKSFGFYDANISRTIEEQFKGTKNVKQKLIELSLKGAELGDAITWGALWNACEYEVGKGYSGNVRSEQFYQEVGKKLREVVYKTQVVDSTLTRSQMMRSKSGMTQEASAFMSEPTLSLNMLMDAKFEFQMEKRRNGTSDAWKKTSGYIGKTLAVYSFGQLTAALLEGFWDAWRDEDDEEFSDKFWSAFGQNALLDLAPFNKVPIISDIFEWALSTAGIGFFSSDKMSTSWLTQGKDAIDAWKDYFNGKGVTPYGAFYKSLRAFSSFTGVPVTGVMREGVDLWNNTAGAIDEEQKILKWERKVEDRVKLIMDAYEDGDTASAKERYEKLLKELASDKDADEARSSIKSSIGTLYKDGVYSKALTSRILEKYIGLDENEIYWTFDRWDNTTDGYAKFDNLWEAVEDGENLKDVIEEYTEHGVEIKTLRSSITSHFKPLYLALEGKEKANMKKMLLDAYQALGVDRADASKNIDRWKESEE